MTAPGNWHDARVVDRSCFGDDETRFTAFGVPVRARANRADLRDRLREVMPPHATPEPDLTTPDAVGLTVELRGAGACPCGEHHPRRLVVVDGAETVGGGSDDTLVARARAGVKLAVAERAPRHVFVHAGAVVVGGRAIVIPGHSFSGKTTLVRALVERGAGYLSDDYAVVDEAGHVHPFAQRLGMRAPGSPEQREVDPAEIGWVAAAPVPLGLVVVTRYVAGTHLTPEPLTRAGAVADLMSHAVAGRSAPARVLAYLATAAAGASAYRGVRGEAAPAAEAILAIADRRA